MCVFFIIVCVYEWNSLITSNVNGEDTPPRLAQKKSIVLEGAELRRDRTRPGLLLSLPGCVTTSTRLSITKARGITNCHIMEAQKRIA